MRMIVCVLLACSRLSKYWRVALAMLLALPAVSGCMASASEPHKLPAWSRVTAGSRVYMGADEAPLRDNAQAICPSVETYYKWVESSRLGKCIAIAHGTPAIVERILHHRTRDMDSIYGISYVELRAVDRRWHGFTALGDLQPSIPLGTEFIMERNWTGPLTVSSVAESVRGLDLGHRAKVRVLRYDPKHRTRTLFVRVLDGKHAGVEGWMSIQDSPYIGDGEYGVEN